MIEDGAPVTTGEYEVGGGINVSSRLIKGGGYAVKLPYIDVSEIGAGGGSIVRVDAFGRIRVGPDSAGASPGPACYGRGGADATLTDALVVLGYLDPAQLAGGDLPIDASLAEQALDAALAAPLGIGRTEAAYGALTLSVATMTRAVKAVSTYRGRDPREFTLCAFGGNGPVVGAAIAQELDIATVVIPPSPGVFSAAGLIHSGSEYQFSKSVPRSARAPSRSELHALYDELEAQVRAMVTDDGGEGDAMVVTRLADLRYAGQAFELTVPVDGGAPDPVMLAQRFRDEHRRTYGHASDDPVQLASLRVVARSGAGSPAQSNGHRPRTVLHAATTRQAYFGVHGALDTPVLVRDELTRGPRRGPLIIQEYDATTVVPPGWSASLDDHANIELTRGERR
jgi:N-methylhydantoinase A